MPWLYRALERRKGAAADAERLARREEIRLIDSLAGAGETDGVIGIEARSRLKRLPSNVYWQGLAAWGLRTLSISQSEYHRFFSTFASRTARRQDSQEDEGDRDGSRRQVWHEGMPEAPDDFPGVATFSLRKEEAEYLRERMLSRQPGKLLAYLIDQSPAPSECVFPWEHPQQAVFPERNRVELSHARRFSVVMHGATLLYNLLLAEASESEDLIQSYRDDLDAWAEEIEVLRSDLVGWERPQFWRLVRSENPRIPVPTQAFINAWLDFVLAGSPAADVRDRLDARTMIANREKRLKGALSRLANANALRMWGGESAANQLSYRWTQVQTIVNDIVRGLHGA